MKKASHELLSMLKRHLQDPSHTIIILMKDYMSKFCSTYSKVCKTEPFKSLYNHSIAITTGEVSLEESFESMTVDYEAVQAINC